MMLFDFVMEDRLFPRFARFLPTYEPTSHSKEPSSPPAVVVAMAICFGSTTRRTRLCHEVVARIQGSERTAGGASLRFQPITVQLTLPGLV